MDWVVAAAILYFVACNAVAVSEVKKRVKALEGETMKLEDITKLVRCEADEDEDDVVIEWDKAKHATKLSVLIVVDGDEAWIPYSQLVAWNPGDSEATVTHWIAQEKGLA